MAQPFDLDIHLSLVEFCRACRVPEEELRAWVVEGLLEPSGERPEEWRFAVSSLRRARTAFRLSRDLEVNVPGIALALALLDEIDMLRARLAVTSPAHDSSSPAE